MNKDSEELAKYLAEHLYTGLSIPIMTNVIKELIFEFFLPRECEATKEGEEGNKIS